MSSGTWSRDESSCENSPGVSFLLVPPSSPGLERGWGRGAVSLMTSVSGVSTTSLEQPVQRCECECECECVCN